MSKSASRLMRGKRASVIRRARRRSVRGVDLGGEDLGEEDQVGLLRTAAASSARRAASARTMGRRSSRVAAPMAAAARAVGHLGHRARRQQIVIAGEDGLGRSKRSVPRRWPPPRRCAGSPTRRASIATTAGSTAPPTAPRSMPAITCVGGQDPMQQQHLDQRLGAGAVPEAWRAAAQNLLMGRPNAPALGPGPGRSRQPARPV